MINLYIHTYAHAVRKVIIGTSEDNTQTLTYSSLGSNSSPSIFPEVPSLLVFKLALRKIVLE